VEKDEKEFGCIAAPVAQGQQGGGARGGTTAEKPVMQVYHVIERKETFTHD